MMLTNENLKGGKFTLSRSNSDVTYKGINLLHGTDDIKNTTRWANSYTYLYKLSYGPSDGEFADTFGWYWGAKDGGSFLIDGHTAWLAIPGVSSTRSFIVDSTTTDVDLMDCTRKRVIYNIKGQRAEMINNKGLYVVNGRIVLIK